LEPEKIKALIDFAEKMAAFVEAEMELVHEIGGSPAESGLTELVDGCKFTAEGLRDS
jgi:hypothetical protein